MTEVKIEIRNIPEAYSLLNKLTDAGYIKQQDFTWEIKNHIREFSFESGVAPQDPRHVIFTFVDPVVACWFKLAT
jgi:hypothetical protein